MILIRKYYWRKIEFVDNEKEDRRNTRDAYKKSTLEIIVGGWEDGGRWAEFPRVITRWSSHENRRLDRRLFKRNL